MVKAQDTIHRANRKASNIGALDENCIQRATNNTIQINPMYRL